MKIILPLCALILGGCNAAEKETTAHIIERKLLPDSQLMIHYSFRAGTQTITDSIVTGNKVIPHDSLTVVYSASDPTKNTLKFE